MKIKKMRSLVVSKPKKHNLRYEIAKKIIKEFSRKKKHSFNADTKLQVYQINRKIEANFNKPLFI